MASSQALNLQPFLDVLAKLPQLIADVGDLAARVAAIAEDVATFKLADLPNQVGSIIQDVEALKQAVQDLKQGKQA